MSYRLTFVVQVALHLTVQARLDSRARKRLATLVSGRGPGSRGAADHLCCGHCRDLVFTAEAARRASCRPKPGCRYFSNPFSTVTGRRGHQRVLQKYRDRNIDLADACLIRLADEMGTADILTFDQDLRIYCWGRSKRFHVLAGGSRWKSKELCLPSLLPLFFRRQFGLL